MISCSNFGWLLSFDFMSESWYRTNGTARLCSRTVNEEIEATRFKRFLDDLDGRRKGPVNEEGRQRILQGFTTTDPEEQERARTIVEAYVEPYPEPPEVDHWWDIKL